MKRALVTGATSGIGKELSYLLAEEGISLCLTGRNQNALEELKKDLGKKVEVITLQCDLASPQERKVLVDLIHLESPDLIINNAGFGTYGRITAYETSKQLEMTEVMVNAVLELTLESAKVLINKKMKGTIVNISSVAAFLAMPLMANYAACKAYTKALSIGMDHELSPLGIRVLCSCPGVVKTSFRKTASGGDEKQFASYFDMDADFAAKRIIRQIASGKRVDVFDWKYRMMTALLKFIPEPILSRMIASSVSKITPENKL